ncbi:MAG: VirK/YbjX family protein [Campylobacteraceae bacterium]|jgi:uncharacterized protein VirK/YbjX|nr:VirK/YbjX family protein [Campylobacteraceae bacterium]
MNIDSTIQYIGRSLYKTHLLKERKRYIIFLIRCHLHRRKIENLLEFFAKTTQREQMLLKSPSFVEQATRSFFYKKSTFSERADIIKSHIGHLEALLKKEALNRLYVKNESLKLWQDGNLSMELLFEAGQRKEGCLSLVLLMDSDGKQTKLYQIIFWFAASFEDNAPSIYIGALQGLLDGADIIKELTKAFHGYRTKNLIFYALRNVAKLLACRHIYAVSNSGHYAMNNIRIDRKVKTSLDRFWEECEGVRCRDKRFYKIPIEERRKGEEELKSQKRSQYRKRFHILDEMSKEIEKNLNALKS